MTEKTSDEKSRREQVVNAVKAVGSVGGGITKAAAASGLVAPGAATGLGALFGLLPAAVALIAPKVYERKMNLAKAWWDETVMANAPAEGVAAEINARLDEVEVQETVMLAARRLLEAVSDDSMRPLAVLTREYARAGKVADAFFRGVANLLTELTGPELAALRYILTFALQQAKGPRVELGYRSLKPDAEAELVVVWWDREGDGRQGGGPQKREVGSGRQVPEAGRLFHLLKLNGLGVDNPGGYFGVSSGPYVIDLETGVTARLLALL